MIRTPRQLKALVRNMSKGNSEKAKFIIRNYVMERFLERMSISDYRNNLILKGGVLISALVGIDNRSTMDIDTTITSIPLNVDSVREIVEIITNIELDDGMTFVINKITPIMDEADYPGIRVYLEAIIENMRTPFRLDFSTGDIITPSEITYTYKLLFEERNISILSYNLETILAEKLETIISRGTANSRMRDYYDVFVLLNFFAPDLDINILNKAIQNTSNHRGSSGVLKDMYLIVDEIENSTAMIGLWEIYQTKFDYAADVDWTDVIQAVRTLCASLPIVPRVGFAAL
ncbi:MAG: nucleotidyl transferase AbiEii/AbiGii toxin family protein [Oscillospiraceae bacterium]|nr:nucleotidyl transferase AbiEii/AbiGii toxin family protein [Oscillospiraceae bacterium]